jgi:hypothetical protein
LKREQDSSSGTFSMEEWRDEKPCTWLIVTAPQNKTAPTLPLQNLRFINGHPFIGSTAAF